MKNQFIQNEIWTLTIAGAFQRAGVYKNNAPEIEKKYFKNMLKGYIEGLLGSYKNSVNEQTHINNIKELSEYSKNFKDILTNGKMNIGISQKMLNLYLKYQWCLNNIVEPPHFPVDRIIQQKLNCNPIIAWTKITTIKEYMQIINFAKEQLTNKQALAELELVLFERRN